MSASLAIAAKSSRAASTMPWISAGFSEDSFAADAGLSGTVHHFVPDRAIYEEGDQAKFFYKVVKGIMRTCRFLSDGHHQIDAFHAEGDVFGFEAGARSRLSAEAVSECQVIAYRHQVDELAAQEDRLARQFFAHAMTCLARSRNIRCCWAAARRSEDRHLPAGDVGAGGTRRCGGPAHQPQDIADYLGLTMGTGIADLVASRARRRHRPADGAAGDAEGPQDAVHDDGVGAGSRRRPAAGLFWRFVSWPGLVPAIHDLRCRTSQSRGWPDQVRP